MRLNESSRAHSPGPQMFLAFLAISLLWLTFAIAAHGDETAPGDSAVSKKRGVTAEFVPMIAHGKDANSWYYDRIMALKRNGNVTCLLGFNEPERKPPGGNISVDDAIKAWPLFEKTGLRLGSPAPAFDDKGRKWLTDFMAKAEENHLRVDFVAVHWYGDVSDPRAAAKFAAWLTGIHKQYKKPVWITEFGGLNWGWIHHPITAAMNSKFLADIEPQMERTDWIERYCWFSSESAALYADSKRTTLSPLGIQYRDGGRATEAP
jgi:hypothetical protein